METLLKMPRSEAVVVETLCQILENLFPLPAAFARSSTMAIRRTEACTRTKRALKLDCGEGLSGYPRAWPEAIVVLRKDLHQLLQPRTVLDISCEAMKLWFGHGFCSRNFQDSS